MTGTPPAAPAATHPATPPAPDAPPAADTPPAAPPAPADTPPAAPASPWEDPAAAEAEIKRLRQENGAARTTAKAQAAEEARRELAQTIGKAIGLVQDEPADPAVLVEQLTKSQAEAKQARVELAIFRSANQACGDPAALLDSSSFLRTLDGIDPADDAAVKAAIEAAVVANPRLGVAQPRPPAPNPAQGATGTPVGIDAQIAAAETAGDFRLAIALKRQKAYGTAGAS